MAKITPIYSFYTHEEGDILYARNDEKNMVTTDRQISGLYSFIGQGVRVGWEVTKLSYDASHSSELNDKIREEQIELFDSYLENSDSYNGRRILAMNMQPIITCKYATTTNISLSGHLTIDGFLTQQNDIILVKNQNNSAENGIYIVGASNQAWTRHSSLDSATEIKNNYSSASCFWVTSGSLNSKTIWTLDIFPQQWESGLIGTTALSFQNAFEQCVRVTPGDGIVGLYKAETNEYVYFRYLNENLYYVWATASPCLVTESKSLIVSPTPPDYSYDTYNTAVYLASVQVNRYTGNKNNVYVDYVEYDDRRYNIQNLDGAVKAALRKAFYKHVHLGGTDNPSKINLTTNFILYGYALETGSTIPIEGTTILFLSKSRTSLQKLTPWNDSLYGIPVVRLNNIVLPTSAYSIRKSESLIFLKNSIKSTDVIQVTVPISSQITLIKKPGTDIRNNPVYLVKEGGDLTDNFEWSPAEYLDPLVYINDTLISKSSYLVRPGSGSITFIPPRTNENDVVEVILEKVGRQIQGTLSGKRIKDINASLFVKNEIDIRRLGKFDHLGLARILEPAFFRPYKRLFSSGNKQIFYPEDTSQDLQLTTELHTIARSENVSNNLYIGSKRGFFGGTSLYRMNLLDNWNPDNGEIIKVYDNLFRDSKASFSSTKVTGLKTKRNYFRTVYVLTRQGTVYKSEDNGIFWERLKLPIVGTSTALKVTSFLPTTHVEQYSLTDTTIDYKFSTLLYLGTNLGLYTATIEDGQSDADWKWTNAWDTVTGNKTIYAIEEIVTQNETKLEDQPSTYTYDRTIYIGSDKGFSIHPQSGQYSSSKLVISEPTKGILWIRSNNGFENSILWHTDKKIYLSHTAREFTLQDTETNAYWLHPLSGFNTTIYSDALKISCRVLLNYNLTGFSNNAFANPPSVVDGVTLQTNDKILLRNQVDTLQNGVYVKQANNQWTRLPNLLYNNWVYIESGDNWARSAWSLIYKELSNPANQLIDYGTDQIFFEELYTNPVDETSSSYSFKNAVERSITDVFESSGTQYLVCTQANVWILRDRRISSTNYLYEYDYILSSKGNWDLNNQFEINSIFIDSNAADLVYIASDAGLYYTNNQGISSRLQTTLLSNLNTNGNSLAVTQLNIFEPSFLQSLGANLNVVTNNNTQTYSIRALVDGLNSSNVKITTTLLLNVSVQTGNTGAKTYTINIDGSSPARTQTFNSGSTVFLLDNVGSVFSDNRKITNITWYRYLTSNIFDATANISVFDENLLQISVDGKTLLGLENAENYTLNQNFQYVKFNSAQNIGKSYLYENEFTNYYTEPWDVGSDTFVIPYISDINNEVRVAEQHSLNAELGKVTFLLPLQPTDKVLLTIIKLNKFISNTGVTPHEEQFDFLKRRESFATEITNIIPANAKAGDSFFVLDRDAMPDPKTFGITNYVIDFYAPGRDSAGNITSPYIERAKISITYSASGLKQFKFLADRPTGSRQLVPRSTESEGTYVYLVERGVVAGIEDEITLAQTNQYYNFNSVAGDNIAQLSLACLNARDDMGDILLPNLFDNFPTPPVPAFADESRRGPVNALFFDFDNNILDARNSSSSFFVGIEPTKNNTPTPPNAFYVIYNPSYSGDMIRVGTNNGIWIYQAISETISAKTWKKETNLDGASRVYFIKPSESNVNLLMAGTDLGLYEQQINGLWAKNYLYPQTIFDHSSGSWGTLYNYSAYGKSDGLVFVRTSVSDPANFESDQFRRTLGHSGENGGPEILEDLNVYSLYKSQFAKYVDDGRGGLKLQLTDALYLSTNQGLFGVVFGTPNRDFSRFLVGREMFGANRNKISLNAEGTLTANVKFYKMFNLNKKVGRSNLPPTPVMLLSSNGVYTIVNWRWCDPGDINSSDFTIANHNLVGIACYCFATTTIEIDGKENFKTFIGTEKGLYRCYDQGVTFEKCERINGEDLVIYDIKFISDTCLLVATNRGLWYSNDEGDTWYKTDKNPTEGSACTNFRSSIDGGEFFVNGYLAQTFIPKTSTLNKVSLYLGIDEVNANDNALTNTLSVEIYQTSNGLPTNPIAIDNISNINIKFASGYRNTSINSYLPTRKFTDNLEFDNLSFESFTNSSNVGDTDATISAICFKYSNNYISFPIDKMKASVYYTFKPTMVLERSTSSNPSENNWDMVYEFQMPTHLGIGYWENIEWNLNNTKVTPPNGLSASILGSPSIPLSNRTYSYKITSYTYLGESHSSQAVTINAQNDLSSNYKVRLQWNTVNGALGYRIYGRISGQEKLLADVANNITLFDDIGTGPSNGAASAPSTDPAFNTSGNLGDSYFYRISLKDSVPSGSTLNSQRIASIGDFRLYSNELQYILPELLTANEISYPGFRSFIIQVSNLSTSSTYALVASERTSSGQLTDISDPARKPIFKWFKTNI